MSFLPNDPAARDVFFRQLERGYALLDDAAAVTPVSRLYHDLQNVLHASDGPGWHAMLDEAAAALQQGLVAVALLAYDTALPWHEITPYPQSLPSRILLFRHCELLDTDQVAEFLEAWAAHCETAAPPGRRGVAGVAGLHSSVDAAAFGDAIARIRAYIEAGDTYQVNYTYRWHFQAYGAVARLYQRLRARQPVPYGALIGLPSGETVLSCSPELFVRQQGGQLLARPMKGTAAASGEAEQDRQRAAALAADAKNRAENLMIVDLLRNDLGRIAATGTVQVPQLFEVQRFASVLQMTSTVTAQLAPGQGLAEILAALFPCGSITGAPKHRTMQIIRELESEPRGLYTGAIGWLEAARAPEQVADFCLSVPIRTLHLQPPDRSGLRAGVMGVGAGIVYDSEAPDEYAECQLKARFLTALPAQFALLETLRVSREHACPLWPRHLRRLRQSAAYFGIACDEAALTQAVLDYCAALPAQTAYRLRLCLHGDGRSEFSGAALADLPERPRVLLADTVQDSTDLFLRHKTTLRQRYDLAWQEAERQGAFDMLFFNQDGHLTEGARSNVVLEIGGQRYTPPLSDGLLPGVMRAALLDDPAWAVTEKSLTRADLQAADRIYLCNALRGCFEARL